MTRKDSLGKGLGALFSDLVDSSDGTPRFTTCGIEELKPNKFQPRKFFDGDEQKQLVESIRKSGIIQPIVVRKIDDGYEIIAGERRWRAAQAARLKDVPIIIKEADDREVAEFSLIENIQREDLNPIEEAHAYHNLITRFMLSQEEISERTGKDRSTVANSLRLLKLPHSVQNELIAKTISAGHARALLSLDSPKQQEEALKDIVRKGLSVREAEALSKKIKEVAVTKKIPEKSESVVSLENDLSHLLMTRVQISQSKKGGAIQIRYRSMDELNRLINLIMDVKP
ncbi:MAG: ParB/RepB/Spo0J family partition protein [Deltaproteobacteria bacterium]|nr:ParB/RepB/Spo0J family partition protein [Deltaproteobacteria bacterium]